MQSEKFDVVKFIARGSYATVYEIVYPPQGDETAMWPTTKTTKWALKRIYLQNDFVVRCALRGHHILVRLTYAVDQGTPVFVLRMGSGFNLQDLISNVGFLDEEDARFYSSEIICGLEYLHTMRIVHLDVKPTNMLIADSGHLFITDFDRRNHRRRLDIDSVRCLELCNDVNLEEVVACKMEPTYYPSNLKVSAAQEKFKLDPYDPLLLAAAYDKHMPLIDRHLRHIRKKGGVRRLEVVEPNRKLLKSAGLTTSRIDELLADFNFINPRLQSSHEVKETQTGSGNKDASSELKLGELEGCSSLLQRSKRRSRKLSSVVTKYSHL
uniref:Agc family protein kinase n=1 Tax=Echinococcus granulosus TaxID=6210 RepID=A0A068X3U7_ECHGR|nr:agc family protein kinase [Echinococcus granulosus]